MFHYFAVILSTRIFILVLIRLSVFCKFISSFVFLTAFGLKKIQILEIERHKILLIISFERSPLS